MTPAEMLDFLNSRLNYERRGMPQSTELRLDRMHHFMDALGRPHEQFSVVHLAGTKGKGTTAHLVSKGLRASGYRVGLHTSPHFLALEERFQVDGEQANPVALARLMDEIVPHVRQLDRQLEPEQPGLTFFEITTALCLLWFAREGVQWGVIEVGMGGRLDSTNVVLPEVAVITSISRDHVKQLGGTLSSIAGEKAGVIKPGRPVVSGVSEGEAKGVIERVAAERGAPMRLLGRDFQLRSKSLGLLGSEVSATTWRAEWPTLTVPLVGEHQAINAALALATFDTLSERGVAIDRPAIAQCWRSLDVPGRFEVVARQPALILDVAHNEASIAAMLRTIDQCGPWGRRLLIVAVSSDKEWRSMAELVASKFDVVIATTFSNNPRALPAETLAQCLREHSRRGSVIVASNVVDAYRVARDWLEPLPPGPSAVGEPPSEDLICLAGSFYVIAEFKSLSQPMLEARPVTSN